MSYHSDGSRTGHSEFHVYAGFDGHKNASIIRYFTKTVNYFFRLLSSPSDISCNAKHFSSTLCGQESTSKLVLI